MCFLESYCKGWTSLTRWERDTCHTWSIAVNTLISKDVTSIRSIHPTSRIAICYNSEMPLVANCMAKVLPLCRIHLFSLTYHNYPSFIPLYRYHKTCLHVYTCFYSWICMNYFPLNVKKTMINQPVNDDVADYENDNYDDEDKRRRWWWL